MYAIDDEQRYDISNVHRVGHTEVQYPYIHTYIHTYIHLTASTTCQVELVQQLVDGVTTVLRLEQKLADGFSPATLTDLLAM